MLKSLTPETVIAIVTAILGAAAAFGLPITQSQSQSVLELAGAISTLLLVHSAVSVNAKAKATVARIQAGKPGA